MTSTIRGGVRELRQAAGLPFLVIAFAARIPLSMTLIGTITFVTVQAGSVTAGGLASGIVGICAGISGPVMGWMVDRWGQRRLLLVVAVANPVSLVLLMVSSRSAGSTWIFAACITVGFTTPPVGPLTRTRWLSIVNGRLGRPVLDRAGPAMSYEGMVDQLAFVLGPVLTGGLAVACGILAPLLATALISAVFVTLFALHPTALLTKTVSNGPVKGTFSGWLVFPLIGMVCLGAYFGSSLASLTEFLDVRGLVESTGIYYGGMGLSAGIASLLMARVPGTVPLASKSVAAFGSLALVTAALPFVTTVAGIAVVYFVLGLAIGPAVVVMYELGAEATRGGHVTTAMTLVGGASVIGQSVMSVVAGRAADTNGFGAASSVVTASALVALLVSLTLLITVRQKRSDHRSTDGPAREPVSK